MSDLREKVVPYVGNEGCAALEAGCWGCNLARETAIAFLLVSLNEIELFIVGQLL